jgi:meso-butanediol dehydrogenase/(S,S)-butanediol dehydrogenase/diacetyl reductase
LLKAYFKDPDMRAFTHHRARAGQDSVLQKSYSAHAIIRRRAEPEEIAKAIMFLASKDADYMTGKVLVKDGGYNLTKL